mgnify:CR=1 FL=1
MCCNAIGSANFSVYFVNQVQSKILITWSILSRLFNFGLQFFLFSFSCVIKSQRPNMRHKIFLYLNISSFSSHFLSCVVRSEIFRADIQGAVHAMKDSNLWMNSNIRHSDVLSLQAFLLRKVSHNMIGWKRMIVDLPAPQNLLLPRAARKLYHLVLKTTPLKPATVVLVNLIFSFFTPKPFLPFQ